jgi:RNA polymerase sigma-70 factor, ECF subfamily
LTPAALAERVVRESYGRLLSMLAARSRDIAAAEDALADALTAALTVWPRVGAPDNPEAWLFAAARRKLVDAARRAHTAVQGEEEIQRVVGETAAEAVVRIGPDRRLGLMFACAHPDIETAARTPLMLQTVLAFPAARIASAFMVAPAAMSQRLVRAKKRIAEARTPFVLPPPEHWTERLGDVLDAIYAAYAEGWSDPEGANPQQLELAGEAIWLARVLLEQLPDEPEVMGLLALMLHLEARRPARRVEGRFVPLEDQEVSLWRADEQAEAERILERAAVLAQLGRFQLEAAIQSAHAARRDAGQVDWTAIVVLYDGLAALVATPVVRLNRAAAIARRDGAAAGLAALDAIEPASLLSYQPYWALRADLFAKLERADDAREAYDQAIARERDGAVIRFLSERRSALEDTIIAPRVSPRGD